MGQDFRHCQGHSGNDNGLEKISTAGLVGHGVLLRLSAKEVEAAPTASIVALSCRFFTTVPCGRLVGLVGEAPSARLDEARIQLNYCRRHAG
jgi:hypothetical protein